MKQQAVDMRNVLILLGLVITTMSLIYFATEFADLISDWGRAIALALLAIMFVGLGAHFEQRGDSTEVLSKSGWRWLKVTNAFYVLGAVGAFSAVIAFFAIDSLDRVWKVLATLVVGVGLIAFAGWRHQHREEAAD